MLWFSCQGTSRDIVYQSSCWFAWLIFVQHGLLWNSTHCLLSPFTLDWSRNLLHNPMQNMAVNNISYIIYPLSTRIEKGYTIKMIPFFFVKYIKGKVLFRSCKTLVNKKWRQKDLQIYMTNKTHKTIPYSWKVLPNVIGTSKFRELCSPVPQQVWPWSSSKAKVTVWCQLTLK